ncbi:MAG: LysM peptidoglycan-binding domain-containing protein [Gemmatimonadota bacterium]
MTEVRDRVDPGRRVRDSVLLTPGDAPGLWAMVTELATRVGTRPPDEVRAVAAASAQVSEECRFLRLLAGTRRLYVGLPLLMGLTADELRAAICHELGRYARGHTRIGPDAAVAAAAGKAAGVLMAIFAVIVLGGAVAAAIGTSAATAPPSGPVRRPVPVVAPSWPPLAAPTWPPPSLPFASRPPFLPVRHTVQPGDTLHSLACRYFTTVRALRQANHLGHRDVIHAGQVLNIPEFSDLSRPGCG